MNKTTITLSRIAAVTGIALGAFSLAALADWVNPISSPPTCVAGNPGCDVPLNMGTTAQYKNSALAIAKSSVPSNGYSLDVGGSGWFSGGLGINGNLTVVGSATTTNLTTTGTTNTQNLYIKGLAQSSGTSFLAVGRNGVVTTKNMNFTVKASSSGSGFGSCGSGQVMVGYYIKEGIGYATCSNLTVQ